MRKFGRRSAKRGEVIAMVLTSVLVLSVLTVTGVYIKNRNSAQEQDGYYIDFDALEAELNEEVDQLEAGNDLDYTGTQEEYDFSKQGMEAVQSGSIEKENSGDKSNTSVTENQVVDTTLEENIVVQTENQQEATAVANNSTVTNIPTLSFSEEDSLVWPIVGSVLINYSMDKTVYFATLDQYKYSPAMVIAATEGEQITAATDAVITKIYESNELGNVVEMNLGNGYTLTYGQLGNIKVTEGQYVTTGQIIGQAGAPTKYYSVEGCNVYFKLTKDGEPINPMTYME